jgi:hypothetical protein
MTHVCGIKGIDVTVCSCIGVRVDHDVGWSRGTFAVSATRIKPGRHTCEMRLICKMEENPQNRLTMPEWN